MFFLTGWAIPILILASVTNINGDNLNPSSNKFIEILNPSPTNTPSPTPLPPTPTLSPTPTSTPSATPKPTKIPVTKTPTLKENELAPRAMNDTALDLMKQINDFRSGKSLPAFTTDGYTCAFAVTRAAEIVDNFSHDGFRSRIDNKTLPYPSFTGISENIAMNSDPNAVVQGWIDSPGHNENLSKQHAHACVAKNGNYYVFLSWNP